MYHPTSLYLYPATAIPAPSGFSYYPIQPVILLHQLYWRQEGVLEEVGTDYLVLRQGSARTGCDLYALKFIELTDSAGT